MENTLIVAYIAFVGWYVYYLVTDTTELTLIQDLTVSNQQLMDMMAIYGLCGFDRNFNQGAKFRHIGLMNDTSACITELSLKHGTGNPGMNWCIDFQKRFQDVVNFKSDIKKAISDTFQAELNIPHLDGSSGYFRLTRELNILAKSKARRKILVVNSPLFERYSFFDNTTEDGFQMLIDNPLSVARLLNAEQTFYYLNGIEILFVYEPMNELDAKRYNGMVDVYKSLFTCLGAKITIVHPNKTSKK